MLTTIFTLNNKKLNECILPNLTHLKLNFHHNKQINMKNFPKLTHLTFGVNFNKSIIYA